MVLDACATDTLYKDVPARFEAGTPNIAGAIGLGAALDFISSVGLDVIYDHEQKLIAYTIETLKKSFGDALTILGTQEVSRKSGIISFTLEGVHPHDVAQLLGDQSICIRAGLQCAAPLHESLRLPASARISLSLYNTEADIDQLVAGLKHIRTVL
jgi:cysteine desulfurase/selenocysteine lyase